jgi:hypothetical protein
MPDLTERRRRLKLLLAKVEDAPSEWFAGPAVAGGSRRRGGTEPESCSTWRECSSAWDTAIRMRDDLTDALAVILAICASTAHKGNQLFVDLIGSPGSAKTTLCQGLLVSDHCIAVENMTKILSGYKKKGEEDKDCSFLARANGKTWVTCEFDVLGSSSEYAQLMGKMRRIFDGETSSTYGNDDEDRIYTSLRTPWIRAGTQHMMDRMADRDQSQLGDRFLRFVIGEPDNVERREIARSALRSERAALMDSVVGGGSVFDALTCRAHALTGGYVDWLRANVEEKIPGVVVPEYADEFCLDLGELAADLRSRPCEDKRKLDVNDFKEMPTRLARQVSRLAHCLAVVLNKFIVDTEVLRIVRKVALDTALGHSLKIVQWLSSVNPRGGGRTYQETGGLMTDVLVEWTKMNRERLEKYLTFLQKVGVLEFHSRSQTRGLWTLTDRVYQLYLRVMRG